ncbi:hypothetical protein ACFV0G_37295, partial [Kitasatospora sp. NPDC059571]
PMSTVRRRTAVSAVAALARGAGAPPRRRPGAAADPEAAGTGRHRRAESPAEQAPAEQSPAEQSPAAVPPQAAPVVAAGPDPAAGAPAAGGLLPRRVRQASLAPQLKDTAEEAAEPVRERSPEEARAAFASFQRGFQRGRGDRLQPASLTVVPDLPESQGGRAPEDRRGPLPYAGPVRPRIALPSAPVPPARPAGRPRPAQLYPVRSGTSAPQVPPAEKQPSAPRTPADRPAPPAQPAPAEGTEQ